MQGQNNSQNSNPFIGQNNGQIRPINDVYGPQPATINPATILPNSGSPVLPANSNVITNQPNPSQAFTNPAQNLSFNTNFNQPGFPKEPTGFPTPPAAGPQANIYSQNITQVNPFVQTSPHPSTLAELKTETTAHSTASNLPSSDKPQSKKIQKSIIILVLTIILIAAICIVTVLALPNSAPGIWLRSNTFLRSLGSTNNQNTTANSSTQKSSSSSSVSKNIDEFAFQPATGSKPVVQIIEESLPAVLSISLKSRGDSLNLSQDLSAGSGYIVSTDGLVVTNKHVVSIICKNDADRIQITGLTHDQKAYNLILKSIDPIDDLAILQIDAKGERFPTISFGNSDNLKLGQDVVAIGNVLGELQNTVTKGIVSGLNRSFETEIVDQCTGQNFQADNLIQTDAAINRGNSGGPLFNSSGQLIAMNTLGTVDAQNIGLAIPSSTIRNVLDGYANNNLIVRARLGLSSLQINPIRKAQNTWIPTDYGELVFRQEGSPVDPNSAAGEAGIKEGDIILEFNSKKLITTNTNPSPIRREVLNSQAGQQVKLTILKATSKTQTGFTYEQNPVNVDVILGSTNFDLRTKQVVAN